MNSEMRDDVSDVEEPDGADDAAGSDGLTGKPGCKGRRQAIGQATMHAMYHAGSIDRVGAKSQDQWL